MHATVTVEGYVQVVSSPVEDCVSALSKGEGGLATLILNSLYLGLVSTLQDAKVTNLMEQGGTGPLLKGTWQ
jgi:hypothetical protein